VLYYHKCDDCLTTFSSTERHIDLCDCEGKVTFMGVVHGDKYVQTSNKAPCDGRCTHAMGPVCDCGCGGINHGTGRTVQTVIKEGKVQVVDPSKDIYDDMVRGYKFRELKNKAEDLYKKVFGHISPWERDARVARFELNKALGLRVYDRRQKAIFEFIFKYGPMAQEKP
jgi:hypothetical protein